MKRAGEMGIHGRAPQRRPLFVATAAALALLASATAIAQESSPAGVEDRATELDTVVVTANKRVENVREVGASITLIGERQLENMAANSLSDYADYVPGLQVQDNGVPGLTAVSMRGIAAISSGATVASYLDEVPLGSSGLYQAANTLNLDLLPYDIERVEVTRGPQGTLYGAGAIGGLLKYVSREPDPVASEFRIGGGVSSVKKGGTGWNGRFGANLPLVDDRMAVRVGYAYNDLPGYTDSQHDGREDINGGTQSSARIAFGWSGDAFNLRLSAMRQELDFDDRASVALNPATGRQMFGEVVDQLWAPRPFSKDIDLYALTLDWDLGWADVVSATGWSDTKTVDQIDSTLQFGEITNLLLGLPEPGSSYARYSLDLEKFTQEFRLTSKSGGRFEWMLGAFYTKEDGVQGQHVWLGQRDGSPLPAPLDAMFGTAALLALPSSYKETALFANGSWRVTDRLKIDAGVRQARNDQTFSQDVTEGFLVELGSSPGSSSEDVFTWSLSPQFKLGDDTMLYARAATGYQPGGPNVALPGMPPSVDSSMLASYELGLKSQFADRRVQLDLAAFRIDWEDIQVGVQFEGIGGLVNGGEASSEGLELSALFRATDRLQLGLNGAYTRARVKNDFQSTVIPQDGFDVILNTGLAGDRMPYVPKLAWSATAEYYFDLPRGWNGSVGGAFRHVGDRVAGTSNRQQVVLADGTVLQDDITPPLDVGSYEALDLYARIGNGNWSVRTYVNNVADERGWSSMGRAESALTGEVVQLRAVPIQPRTWGVEFDYRF
ncbi:TonB-dependent receptor [Luteimonas sp. SJ-92]|uniref:TonB-dependent receptor n=1 Tax=Luteimonas salinisoli TaxID=2752307 RepID=A0A853J7Q6_9GAMM|nr:TonB-dependent receptor [Luteimonas salinisoli]NZA24792.1 TonB-dependent receptor [Luteimonas salinisoli]